MSASLRREFDCTFRLSVPITIGLVGQGLFGVVDTLMIANILGESALAAATIGHNANWPPLLFAMGLCVAIPVLTAQARGAGRLGDVPAILRHGLLVSVVASLIGATLLCAFILGNGLLWLGQPESVCADAKLFSCIVAVSIPAAAAFQALKSFHDASGGQWISLFWTLFGLLANIFLNWVLMTGTLGFPNWGLEGAAAGTLFSRVAQLAGIALHRRVACEFRKGFSLKEIRENVRIGVPSAFHVLFEAGIFIVAPFFMGWISEAAIAANQIVTSISGLAYMFPMGVGQALSIRVGEAFGEGNPTRIRVIFSGAAISVLAAIACLAVALIAVRAQIPALFNLGPEAAAMAETMLFVAGAYMLFDAFQAIAAGALRGVSDVRIIAVSAFVSYWLVGCPTALILAFPLGLGGLGIWIGLASGLALIACILGIRFFLKSRVDFHLREPRSRERN